MRIEQVEFTSCYTLELMTKYHANHVLIPNLRVSFSCRSPCASHFLMQEFLEVKRHSELLICLHFAGYVALLNSILSVRLLVIKP